MSTAPRGHWATSLPTVARPRWATPLQTVAVNDFSTCIKLMVLSGIMPSTYICERGNGPKDAFDVVGLLDDALHMLASEYACRCWVQTLAIVYNMSTGLTDRADRSHMLECVCKLHEEFMAEYGDVDGVDDAFLRELDLDYIRRRRRRGLP